jgi:hypothetical protein
MAHWMSTESSRQSENYGQPKLYESSVALPETASCFSRAMALPVLSPIR